MTDIIVISPKNSTNSNSTLSTSYPLAFQFNNIRLVYIGTGDYRLMELREESSKDQFTHIYKDPQILMGGYGLSLKSRYQEIGLNTKEASCDYFKAYMDKKLSDVYLINENDRFQKSYRSRLLNLLGIRGLRLIFEEQLILDVVHYGNSLFITKDLASVPFLDKVDIATVFDFKKNFYQTGTEIIDIYSTKHGRVDKALKGNALIARKDLIEGTDIYVDDLSKFRANADPIKSIKDKYSTYLPTAITYLHTLKEDMKLNNFGLADIRFGFDHQMNFGLVGPIDVTLYNESGVKFIDNVIDQLEE